MQNFDFKRNARKCCQTDRSFRPGDTFFSELVETDDGQLQRNDYAADQWNGMADQAIGWWKRTVPELESGKIYWAPDDVLTSYFQSLIALPNQSQEAYVMSLLLLQKKLLTLEDSDHDPSDPKKLLLRNRKSGDVFEVSEQVIAPKRIAEIEQQLCENLFSDQPFVEDQANP